MRKLSFVFSLESLRENMEKTMALRSIFRSTSSRYSRFSAVSHRYLAAATSSTRSLFTLSSPPVAVPSENSSPGETLVPLLTNRSYKYLGLHKKSVLWRCSDYGKGIIIGIIDSGIAPYHPSFNDEGMPPPPAKWKGKWEFSSRLCNNKLIGARNFYSEGKPPYDSLGHGTQVASIAAGSPVEVANYFGQTAGIATGIAPLSHLAIYKVCGGIHSKEYAILAAIKTAIKDGVDVLSISIGQGSLPFNRDAIAVGAFKAIQNGIFVCCAAGNSGPSNFSLSNEAPWILTVGASTTDKEIRAAGSKISEFSPQVATFSSRGPSYESLGILKPDVLGPGVDILAAWPTSFDNSRDPRTYFHIDSGTSFACPHLSGIAALLKASHPDWSPAAIKSAIMTTAEMSNLGGQPISDQQGGTATLFDMGAGHVNPSRANDPGLVYDIEPDDYIPYLHGLGYTNEQVKEIVQSTVEYSNATSIPGAQLNYPSFCIRLGNTPQIYTRTVTNVGPANSVYRNIVCAPEGVDVKVSPDVITFNGVNQKATYTVTFSKKGHASGNLSQGHLCWLASGYSVRSPIAVLFE